MKRLIIIFFLSIIILSVIYFILNDRFIQLQAWLTASPPGSEDFLSHREIGTYKDLWLNGYLGFFFRFKYIGVLNWLSIPLLVYFIVTIRKRKRWEVALCFVFILSVIIIGYKGYENFRYQATLYPFTISAIILFGWEILKKRRFKAQLFVLFFVCVAIFFNCYNIFSPIAQRHLPGFFALDNKKNIDIAEADNEEMKIASKRNAFPYKIVNYINNINDLDNDAVILECNQPILYYYTDKKGLYYFNHAIMEKFYQSYKDRVKAFWILKERLKVQYILTRIDIEHLLKDARWGIINEITRHDSNLMVEDKGYKLYKLKDAPAILD